MKFVIIATLVAVTAGCAIPYQAQKEKVPDGYSHERIAEDVLWVTYQTWRRARPETVCDLAERRAVELLGEEPYIVRERATDTYSVRSEVPAMHAEVPVRTGLHGNHTRTATIFPAYISELQIKRCVLLVQAGQPSPGE